MKISSYVFGNTREGESVYCWVLENHNGMSVEVLSYGGTIRSIGFPMKGEKRDLVLGFDDVEGYERQTSYIGAMVGRVANRIGGACFSLDGKKYSLWHSEKAYCLHGGKRGFNAKNWEGSWENNRLVLRLESPDNDEGFPGNLSVCISLFLSEENELQIDYEAKTDARTIVNLTNHAYFNLEGGGSIENHQVQIFADYITELDENLVPTGRLLSVENTALDLREGKTLREGFAQSHPQMDLAGGYDHNFVLRTNEGSSLKAAAVVKTRDLCMECYTSQRGVQLYTGNFLNETGGKKGVSYNRREGLCLETQAFPDSINKPDFPSIILNPNELYSQKTVFKFKEIQ